MMSNQALAQAKKMWIQLHRQQIQIQKHQKQKQTRNKLIEQCLLKQQAQQKKKQKQTEQKQKQKQTRNKLIEQCLLKQQAQQKKKQKQTEQNQKQKQKQKQNAIQSIYLLFVVKSPPVLTTSSIATTKRRLPSCVRIHGKPKPYAMRHPNLSVTRRRKK